MRNYLIGLSVAVVSLGAIASEVQAKPDCGQYGCIYKQGKGVEQWRGHDGLQTTSYPNGTYIHKWGQTRQWKENQESRKPKSPYTVRSYPDYIERSGPQGCTPTVVRGSGNGKQWKNTCFIN